MNTNKNTKINLNDIFTNDVIDIEIIKQISKQNSDDYKRSNANQSNLEDVIDFVYDKIKQEANNGNEDLTIQKEEDLHNFYLNDRLTKLLLKFFEKHGFKCNALETRLGTYYNFYWGDDKDYSFILGG